MHVERMDMLRESNLLKRRAVIKKLGILSLSPFLAGMGVYSVKEIKDIYKGVLSIKGNAPSDLQVISSEEETLIELTPILLSQIEEYLKEC